LPATQFTLAYGTTGSVRRARLGISVMGPAYPPDGKKEFLEAQACFEEEVRLHEALREDFSDDEHSDDDIVSLLEENARLRGIVVTLTDIILKNVAERR
jgi:hypothetical protein